MNNFPIKHNNKTYWVARNIAVSSFVFTFADGKWHVLANKRGKNAPDFKGCWNVPCGYLDYNETVAQAAFREVYEETGVVLPDLTLWEVSDDPKNNLQNVIFRYYTFLDKVCDVSNNSTERGGEEGEVEEVKWIALSDLEMYKWAFNHYALIKSIAKDLKLIY